MNKLAISNDSDKYFIEFEDRLPLYLKDSQGEINKEGYPWIDLFLAAKKVGDFYEILFRFKNGNFAKWVVDENGMKQQISKLDKKSIKDIVINFNLHQGKLPLSESDYKKLYLKSRDKKSVRILELIIKNIYSEFITQGNICVDGGANVGLHTFPLSKLVGTQGKVYAFEALPHLARGLEKKAARQEISNITVIEKALSNQETILKFNFVRNAPGRSGIKQRQAYGGVQPEFEQIEVESITLDRVLENETSWRFCKLDLEGGEFHCLQGAVKSIQKFSPLIIFENGRQGSASIYGYSREDWFSFFKEIDYKVFDLFGREFTRDLWKSSFIPFYFIAVKSNSKDEEFVREYVPYILTTFLIEKKEASSESISIQVLNDANGYYMKIEGKSPIFLRDKEGKITAERFPWVKKFLGVKRLGDSYEVLFRLKNGKLAEWIVDGSGLKKEYHSLEDETLAKIASYFNINENNLI